MNEVLPDNNCIVIVYDQPPNLKTPSSLHTEEDHQVQTAQDGESALKGSTISWALRECR